MFAAAEDLRFEYAAKLRDEIRDLRRELGPSERRPSSDRSKSERAFRRGSSRRWRRARITSTPLARPRKWPVLTTSTSSPNSRISSSSKEAFSKRLTTSIEESADALVAPCHDRVDQTSSTSPSRCRVGRAPRAA